LKLGLLAVLKLGFIDALKLAYNTNILQITECQTINLTQNQISHT